jgi:hypothetical protein
MTHLERLPNVISVPIKPDEDGYTGRECPQTNCLGYFKVTPGTGVLGDPFCYCPYCGHKAEHDKFFTHDQLEYARSLMINQVTEALLKDMKALEFEQKPRGGFGIGISMKVTGTPRPVLYYRERQLETEIVCDCCTLRYAIYGVFAYCSDCGVHNSRQILEKNLELAEKELALSATLGDRDLSDHLIADALENVVSAFDGFGRETCRVHSSLATVPGKAENVSFQNLVSVRDRVLKLFGLDLAGCLANAEWDFANQCFQKRHLLAHKMAIIDDSYIQSTNDPQAVAGRKVRIERNEVERLAATIRKLGAYLAQQLDSLKGTKP